MEAELNVLEDQWVMHFEKKESLTWNLGAGTDKHKCIRSKMKLKIQGKNADKESEEYD